MNIEFISVGEDSKKAVEKLKNQINNYFMAEENTLVKAEENTQKREVRHG